MGEDNVIGLGSRYAQLEAGWSADLRYLTAEQAATVMCEHFRATGSAQADVSDPAEVRRLIRLDCRRRRVRVCTLAVGRVVAVYDEARHDAFMATPEGELSMDAAVEALEWIRGRLSRR